MNLSDVKYVKALQSNMRVAFDGPPGKEVLKFLESLCGWYDFSEKETNTMLIATGKRQVLATIKTILEKDANEIAKLAKLAKEQ